MDWRTSDEQPDTNLVRALGTDHSRAGSLADVADAARGAAAFGRFALEPALVRELQVARAAGGRFGGDHREGVNE
jgi:hypothetical protein